MIKVKRLGHATIATPDLDAQVDYYGRLLGLTVIERSKDRVFLASKQGLEAIELVKGKPNDLKHVSFQIAPGTDLGDVVKELGNIGIKAERRKDVSPGVADAVTLEDPKGTPIDLYAEYKFAKRDETPNIFNILKLGHVAYRVLDVQQIVKFYSEVLGFRVSDWRGDFFVFMRCNTDHHTVNFIRGNNIKMHHMAFELKDFIHLQNSCDLFGQRKIPIIWGPLRHGPGHNIATYHRNPDDQVIEFFCELDKMVDENLGYFEPRPWHQDTPQRPKTWQGGKTNVWGPPPTPDFHRARD